MKTLEIHKKSLKTWLHVDSVSGEFIISKFYFNANGLIFQIVEDGEAKLFQYNVANITLYDDTAIGTPELFSNITDLSLRLEELQYVAFFRDGQTPIPSLNDLTNVNISAPTDGQVLAYDFSSSKWINLDLGTISVPDATTTIKGKIKLAGDLGGTADSPTVPALANKANTADLGATAFSNDYNDLDNLPTISTGAVESVTGDLVDNTDPNNPVINIPNLQDVTDGAGNNETTNPLIVVDPSNPNNKVTHEKDGIYVYVDGFTEPVFFGYDGSNILNYNDGSILIKIDNQQFNIEDALGSGINLSPTGIQSFGSGRISRLKPDKIEYYDQTNDKTLEFNFPTSIVGTNKTVQWRDRSGEPAFVDELPTSLSQLSEDTTHRTVTDSEKLAWNAKEDASNKTSTVTGNETSTSLYLTVKGYYDYLIGLTWLTDLRFGTWSNGLSAKTTPVDADSFNIVDSADSNKSKKLSLTNFKTFLATTFSLKSMSANSIRVNKTNATANATEQTFVSKGQQPYTGTKTWTGTTPPSGTINDTYNWIQIDNWVELKINTIASSQGVALTAVSFTLPPDCPTPILPSGFGAAANDNIYDGSGLLETATSTSTSARVFMKKDATNSGILITAIATSANYLACQLTIKYPTA